MTNYSHLIAKVDLNILQFRQIQLIAKNRETLTLIIFFFKVFFIAVSYVAKYVRGGEEKEGLISKLNCTSSKETSTTNIKYYIKDEVIRECMNIYFHFFLEENSVNNF